MLLRNFKEDGEEEKEEDGGEKDGILVPSIPPPTL